MLIYCRHSFHNSIIFLSLKLLSPLTTSIAFVLSLTFSFSIFHSIEDLIDRMWICSLSGAKFYKSILQLYSHHHTCTQSKGLYHLCITVTYSCCRLLLWYLQITIKNKMTPHKSNTESPFHTNKLNTNPPNRPPPPIHRSKHNNNEPPSTTLSGTTAREAFF